MGLMRMLFSNKQKEFKIEVPTLILCLTKDELKSLKESDMHMHIMEYGKFAKDVNLSLDYNSIYLFVTYSDKRLKCRLSYKEYLGTLGKVPKGLLDSAVESKVIKLIITSYIILSTRKTLDEIEELNAVSEDLRALKEKFDLIADTEIYVPGNCDIIKYQYEYIDGKLTVEKTEDYSIFSPREFTIGIGEVYILDCKEGYVLYCGSNAGTITIPLKEIDKHSSSVLYKELLKDNIEERINGVV